MTSGVKCVFFGSTIFILYYLDPFLMLVSVLN